MRYFIRPDGVVATRSDPDFVPHEGWTEVAEADYAKQEDANREVAAQIVAEKARVRAERIASDYAELRAAKVPDALARRLSGHTEQED